MEDPGVCPSSPPPGAVDLPGVAGYAERSRRRRTFWIVSALIIVPLAVVNDAICVQKRPPTKRPSPWPAVSRLLEEAPSIDLIALDPYGPWGLTWALGSDLGPGV
jgi:hypothetical protein